MNFFQTPALLSVLPKYRDFIRDELMAREKEWLKGPLKTLWPTLDDLRPTSLKRKVAWG